MYGVLALSIADKSGFLDIPQPSKIIRITFFEIFKSLQFLP